MRQQPAAGRSRHLPDSGVAARQQRVGAANRRSGAEIRDADVLLVHDGFYLPCVQALRRARRDGKPVVIIQHIGFVPYRNPLLRLAMTVLNGVITRPALAAAEQVVFISEITRRHFSTVRFRRPPMILFNGVNTTVFAPMRPGTDRLALRRSLGFDPERPTVLFVGRFVEKKGLSHLEQMARRRPRWDWVLAGWGPIDPAGWRLPNVRVFSDRSGVSLTPLYQAADALVLPIVGEGFPLVVQEALASGLAVVCGDDTAIADRAAQPYLVGVRVRPADPFGTADAFVGALAAIVENAEVGEAERRARAEFARERYSWERMATGLLVVFASLMADDAAVVSFADLAPS
jgi:glycosyltransferase involved in cell wall biosynthesis